jgi:hypothetical protein
MGKAIELFLVQGRMEDVRRMVGLIAKGLPKNR